MCQVMTFLPTEHIPKKAFAPVALPHWMKLEFVLDAPLDAQGELKAPLLFLRRNRGYLDLYFPLFWAAGSLWTDSLWQWADSINNILKATNILTDTEGHLCTLGKNTDFPLKRSQECLFCNKTVEKQCLMSFGAWIEMIYNRNALMPFVALAKSNAEFSLYFSICLEGVFRDKHTESAPHCALCCGACGWGREPEHLVQPHGNIPQIRKGNSRWQNPPTEPARVDVVRGGAWLFQNYELFSSKENLPCQLTWEWGSGRSRKYPSAPGSHTCAGVPSRNLFFFYLVKLSEATW